MNSLGLSASLGWAILVLGSTSGCHSPDEPITVAGTIQTRQFAPTGGDFDHLAPDAEGHPPAILIALADSVNFCELSATGAEPSFDLQWLSVIVCPGTQGPAGTYSVQAGTLGPCADRVAWAVLRRWTNGVSSSQPANGGTVTISSASQLQLSGALALDFSGETVSGKFGAGLCEALNR